MVDTIRKDIFRGVGVDKQLSGYVLLRKEAPDSYNDYLEQVLVRPSSINCKYRPVDFCACIIEDDELFDSIDDGDVGFYTGKGSLRVILSRKANHNTLLVTERCDNLCLFCSQPPKEKDDDELIVQAALAISAFRSRSLIGVSGGEPLLSQKNFLRFLDIIAKFSPETSLHVLSNGRAFSDSGFSRDVANRCGQFMVNFGIPLYSVSDEIHDFLVGSEGAFRETVKGLINAGNCGIPIELRVIPTSYNFGDLELIVDFASRVFSSISQISIMNLEPTGWAKKNWDDLYVCPSVYSSDIRKAIDCGDRAGVPVVLFNYPLCHLPIDLHRCAVKSISDWKNYYPKECNECVFQGDCGGFFASSRGRVHQKPRRFL